MKVWSGDQPGKFTSWVETVAQRVRHRDAPFAARMLLPTLTPTQSRSFRKAIDDTPAVAVGTDSAARTRTASRTVLCESEQRSKRRRHVTLHRLAQCYSPVMDTAT